MKKTLIALLLALALVVIPVSSALADSSVGVTVTATPGVLSISLIGPDTWPINGVKAGDGVIRTDTLYYSNPLGDETAPADPVVDGACLFKFSNDSNVSIDITCDMGDFVLAAGGTDIGYMDNSDGTGYLDNGPTEFGASGYASEAALSYVTFKTTGSSTFITNLAATGSKMWGVALTTQEDAFTSIDAIKSTITCTASYYIAP